jgi:hypothetical protein
MNLILTACQIEPPAWSLPIAAHFSSAKHAAPLRVSLINGACMETLMYYLSHNPTNCAPPVSELLSIDAESTLAAVCKLKEMGRLRPDWQSLWAHVLLWSSRDGKHRGFESIRLADVQELVFV